MPEEPKVSNIDAQERSRRNREATPAQVSDSVTEREARAQRFAAEAAQRAADLAAQEQHQKNRQARHQAEARRIDEETRAALQLRILQAQEGSRSQVEPRPVAVNTPRQDAELEAEQSRGRQMLERYAQKREGLAAARERNEEKARQDATSALPGFKPTG